MSEALTASRRMHEDTLAGFDEEARARRADFPILGREVHGRPLVYLDNAATSQKPKTVIDALEDYYCRYNANVHRGVHTLSDEATNAYEGAREKIARFINAPSAQTLIYVRNTTEGINLVAHAWGRKNIRAGDEIILSVAEHHSNLVPWQMLAEQVGARLRFLGIREDGALRIEELDHLITGRTKLIAIAQMSNVLGTVNPIAEIASAAHRAGAVLVVDAAQSVPHIPVDVQALDCDFLAFSGHKMCGPTGIGGLYGREELLEEMDPFLGGGSMIDEVRLERSTWGALPHKFEAGTPNIAHAVGLGVAVDYLSAIGMAHVHEHELALSRYTIERLKEIDRLTVYGDAPGRGGAVSFNLDDLHPSDLATVLDRQGIAIRAGHHCTQPLMRVIAPEFLATARASMYLYNTTDEIDALVEGILKARALFG